MKSRWLVLAAACAVAALCWVTLPKRREAFILQGKRQIELASGCTVFSPGIFRDEDGFVTAKREIKKIQADGPITMYDTPIGSFWYPAEAWTLPSLVQTAQADPYRLRTTVRKGDVVLDVGANAGAEVRSALDAGAKLVVAFEPEPLMLECLRRNLSSEIREDRVIVVAMGAWDRDDLLPLHVDRGNAGAASLVWSHGEESTMIPVTTIDRVVADLGLTRVDLIKFHVEGAEERAILGAAAIIRRYHPRLAISVEHHRDDADRLPAAVLGIAPGYRVELTSCTKTFRLVHPAAALMTYAGAPEKKVRERAI